MAAELAGKVAAVTGATSAIGQASAEAMLAAGARVVLVDSDEAALIELCAEHGNEAIPLFIDQPSCAMLLPQILDKAGQLDILHVNVGLQVDGDRIDADMCAIDAMLNLNIMIKSIYEMLPYMIERGTGDIVVTNSFSGNFSGSWESVYTSSKSAINSFVQTVRRQYLKYGIRIGSISPDRISTGLLTDGTEATEVADVAMLMLTLPREVNIRDVVINLAA